MYIYIYAYVSKPFTAATLGSEAVRMAWGSPQRVPVKGLNCKGKTEIRETTKNQDLTSNVPAELFLY